MQPGGGTNAQGVPSDATSWVMVPPTIVPAASPLRKTSSPAGLISPGGSVAVSVRRNDDRSYADSPGDDSSASVTDWVLLARSPAAFTDQRLAEVVETIEPNPSFSLWTDQFNNLIDVLKSNPLNELRRLMGLS